MQACLSMPQILSWYICLFLRIGFQAKELHFAVCDDNTNPMKFVVIPQKDWKYKLRIFNIKILTVGHFHFLLYVRCTIMCLFVSTQNVLEFIAVHFVVKQDVLHWMTLVQSVKNCMLGFQNVWQRWMNVLATNVEEITDGILMETHQMSTMIDIRMTTNIMMIKLQLTTTLNIQVSVVEIDTMNKFYAELHVLDKL